MVSIKARFDRGDYQSGDVANVLVEVDNSQCKVDLIRIEACLNRYFTYKTRSFVYSDLHVVKEFYVEGVKEGQKCVGNEAKVFAMPLGSNNPSCHGMLIQNIYSLSIKGKLGGTLFCSNGSPQASSAINFYNKPA